MLKNLIGSRFDFTESQSWQEAIQLAGYMMEKDGICTLGYTKMMIQNVTDMGSYIVLAPGFALPHARPEDGAIKTGMSLIRATNGVIFPDKSEKLEVLIALSAQDKNSYIEALSKLAEILINNEKFELLKTATINDEILSILN